MASVQEVLWTLLHLCLISVLFSWKMTSLWVFVYRDSKRVNLLDRQENLFVPDERRVLFSSPAIVEIASVFLTVAQGVKFMGGCPCWTSISNCRTVYQGHAGIDIVQFVTRLAFLRKFFLTQFSISARKLISERKAFQGIVVRIDNALYVIFNHYLLSLISLRIDLYISL